MLKIIDSELARTSFIEKELIADNTKKIIFMGRSNVGKSSLINKLVGRRKLARTSTLPGKTVSINYYSIQAKIDEEKESFYFVDLPGYGYAKIPRADIQRVKLLIATFFKTVDNVKLVVLLVDSRRGFMDSDLEIISQIFDKKFKLLTVLTKSDKLSFSKLLNQKNALQDRYGLKVISFTIKSDENKVEMLDLIQNAIME